MCSPFHLQSDQFLRGTPLAMKGPDDEKESPIATLTDQGTEELLPKR